MTSPLRVAVVSRAIAPLHGIGGLERSAHDLVVHLARLGVAVTVIAPPPRDPAAPASLPATVLSVPYRSFPLANRRGTTILDRDTAYPLFGWRAGRLAHELVRQGKIDIVHGFGASVFGYALARGRHPAATAPLVLNPQGLEEFGGSAPESVRLKRFAYAPLQFVVRVCARHADRVIATDKALAPVVRRHLDIPNDRLVTIPNAIDLAACDALAAGHERAAVRARFNIPDDVYLLVSAGRLEQNKGFHVMARALGALHDSRPWHWILAGDGSYRPTILASIAEAGIGAQVTLAGRVDDADPARAVWGGRRVRAPDAVRRKFAGHARSHGARRAGDRDVGRGAARQGAAARERLAGRGRRGRGPGAGGARRPRRGARDARALRTDLEAHRRARVLVGGRGGADPRSLPVAAGTGRTLRWSTRRATVQRFG